MKIDFNNLENVIHVLNVVVLYTYIVKYFSYSDHLSLRMQVFNLWDYPIELIIEQKTENVTFYVSQTLSSSHQLFISVDLEENYISFRATNMPFNVIQILIMEIKFRVNIRHSYLFKSDKFFFFLKTFISPCFPLTVFHTYRIK